MEKSIPRNKTRLKIPLPYLLIISGLIFVVFAATIIYFGLKINKNDLKISLTPQVIGEIKSRDNLPNGVEKADIFTRTGKVVALAGKTLYFESTYTQDDKIMKAVFKISMNWQKWGLSPPKPRASRSSILMTSGSAIP
jgi:hypothetical protein